jgi:hypothetical protein
MTIDIGAPASVAEIARAMDTHKETIRRKAKEEVWKATVG